MFLQVAAMQCFAQYWKHSSSRLDPVSLSKCCVFPFLQPPIILSSLYSSFFPSIHNSWTIFVFLRILLPFLCPTSIPFHVYICTFSFFSFGVFFLFMSLPSPCPSFLPCVFPYFVLFGLSKLSFIFISSLSFISHSVHLFIFFFYPLSFHPDLPLPFFSALPFFAVLITLYPFFRPWLLWFFSPTLTLIPLPFLPTYLSFFIIYFYLFCPSFIVSCLLLLCFLSFLVTLFYPLLCLPAFHASLISVLRHYRSFWTLMS